MKKIILYQMNLQNSQLSVRAKSRTARTHLNSARCENVCIGLKKNRN